MNNTISVIVPIYNAEDSLHRCIDSITTQTHSDLQIILVNDGSADQSLSICRAYEEHDKRITVIDIPNGGVSNARNVGITKATGAYLGFVDSDDWIEPTMFEELFNGMQNQTDVSLSIIGLKMPGWKQYLSTLCNGSGQCRLTYEATIKEIISKSLGLGGYVCNKLFLRTEQLFDPLLSFCEDIEFVVRYLSHFPKQSCTVINSCAYHYERTLYESFSSLKYGLDRYMTSLRAYDQVLSHLPIGMSEVHEIVHSRQCLHAFRILKYWTKLPKEKQFKYSEKIENIETATRYFNEKFVVSWRYMNFKHKLQMLLYKASPSLLRTILYTAYLFSNESKNVKAEEHR